MEKHETHPHDKCMNLEHKNAKFDKNQHNIIEHRGLYYAQN